MQSLRIQGFLLIMHTLSPLINLIRRLVIIVVLTAPATQQAQNFNVSVALPNTLKGTLSLTIYDNNASPRTIKKTPQKGKATFTGSVKNATYAELRHSAIPHPLPFFIENNTIRITFNTSNPETSPITGSLTNSQLRYQLEQCRENAAEGETSCLTQYISENPTSIIAPYLLDNYLASSSEYETLSALYEMLDGPAKNTYHYKLLANRMKHLSALAIGAPLPDIVFTTPDGKKTHTDSLLLDTVSHLLLIGATWCDQCKAISKELKDKYPDIKPIEINIDLEKETWDAPFVKTLAIEHIPYLILLDKNGRIVARDVRIWELERIRKQQ